MDQQQVQILLSHLSRRQRQILSLRFGLEGSGRDETLRQIGERLKLSRERVGKIEQDALNKLIHLSRQFNDWA
jgi:DNA-directed RNA polymerase sigma subunit (sigma70/sigma32)